MVLHAVAHWLFASRQRRAAALRRARVILGLVVLLFFACTSIARSEESNTGTIVYSEEQALKGRDLYDEHCASCHGATLEGQGSLPLSGATFRARWADDRHSLDDLFYIIRTRPHLSWCPWRLRVELSCLQSHDGHACRVDGGLVRCLQEGR